MNFKYLFAACLFFLSLTSVSSIKMKLKTHSKKDNQNAQQNEVQYDDLPNFAKQAQNQNQNQYQEYE